jgi:2-polyprenyl-3-methyl-5-hydroxy-6-metoxy-1,4-benzoquinol methylase
MDNDPMINKNLKAATTTSKDLQCNEFVFKLDGSAYGDLSRAEMLPFIPLESRRILDVGCHMGAFGALIKASLKAEVWGVEPNSETAAIAKLALDHVIVELFSDEIQIPDRYFDVIVFNDVLEHMPDPWSALRLAARKLAANGSIVASIPNLRNIENLLHILKESDFKYELNGIRDKTHLRFFTKKSVYRLFEDSGLTVVKVQGVNEDWWRPSLLRKIMFRLFRNYLEDTKYIQFAVIAKRAN